MKDLMDYQGLVTKWREAVRDCPCLECRMRNECADELAEAIARNVQPSPDEGAGWQVVVELEQLKARWWAGISGDGELSTTLTELADKLRKFLLARPVQQPAPEPLRKTIRDIIENEPLGYRTEDEHAKLENFADRILARIEAALALREPAPEPKLAAELAEIATAYHVNRWDKHRDTYLVGLTRKFVEALALRDVPQGQTRRERRLEKALMLAAEFCNTMPGWDKARNMQAAIEEVLAARQVPVGPEGKK